MVNGVNTYAMFTSQALSSHEDIHTAKKHTDGNGDTEWIAQAKNSAMCPLCLAKKAYAVYSYGCLLYSNCPSCHSEYIETTWYSDMTSKLQLILARVFPSYREAFTRDEAQRKQEKQRIMAQRKKDRQARAYW